MGKVHFLAIFFAWQVWALLWKVLDWVAAGATHLASSVPAVSGTGRPGCGPAVSLGGKLCREWRGPSMIVRQGHQLLVAGRLGQIGR